METPLTMDEVVRLFPLGKALCEELVAQWLPVCLAKIGKLYSAAQIEEAVVQYFLAVDCGAALRDWRESAEPMPAGEMARTAAMIRDGWAGPTAELWHMSPAGVQNLLWSDPAYEDLHRLCAGLYNPLLSDVGNLDDGEYYALCNRLVRSCSNMTAYGRALADEKGMVAFAIKGLQELRRRSLPVPAGHLNWSGVTPTMVGAWIRADDACLIMNMLPVGQILLDSSVDELLQDSLSRWVATCRERIGTAIPDDCLRAGVAGVLAKSCLPACLRLFECMPDEELPGLEAAADALLIWQTRNAIAAGKQWLASLSSETLRDMIAGDEHAEFLCIAASVRQQADDVAAGKSPPLGERYYYDMCKRVAGLYPRLTNGGIALASHSAWLMPEEVPALLRQAAWGSHVRCSRSQGTSGITRTK